MIGSRSALAIVDEQHCHRRLLLAVRSRRLGLIPGESSVSRDPGAPGFAGGGVPQARRFAKIVKQGYGVRARFGC
jgi:hypothetical protein